MTAVEQHRFITFLLIAGISALIGCILILSWVPPVSRDALIHHLAIPKLYLKQGGIYEIPDRPFSYYPMNLDLLYLIPLYFGNDIAPKLIHFAFGLMTAWLIYGYLKNRTNSKYALLGVLFFLSIPVILKLSITVYVDLGLIFFSTASLLLLFRWLETSERKWLILSGVLCGLALGTKYNGLISLFLFTLFIPIAYLKYPKENMPGQRKALGCSALFLLISMVVFSPWMIRNIIWTKNPIYPLFDQYFLSSISRLGTTKLENQESLLKKKMQPFVLRKIVYKESGWDIITIPIRIFFQGKDDDPKYFDGKLNPFLILMPIPLLIGLKKDSVEFRFEIKFLLWFSALFIFFVFFQQDMRIRYVGPAIPPLVILSIMGLFHFNALFSKNPSPLGKKMLLLFNIAIISSFLLYNFFYVAKQFHIVNPFSYITGKIDRESYIERFRPEYAAVQYANQALSQNDKVIAFFLGDRGYYMNFNVIFDKTWFQDVVTSRPFADKILFEFRKNGINYILLRFDLFNNWAKTSLNEHQQKTIAAFLENHTKLLYSKAGYGLLKILP